MREVEAEFRERVYELVRQIPKGKVMSYGQIAYLCGSPRAARIVGGIAHWAPCAMLPSCPIKSVSRSGLDEVQGKAEQQTESYIRYGEGVAEDLTPQFAKSKSGATGSASRQALATCPAHGLPWQRVVMKDGSLATGFPGGVTGHAEALRAEGVTVSEDSRVDMGKHLWQAVEPNQNSLL